MRIQTVAPMVGRTVELDGLRAAAAEARDGSPRIVVVGGEAGIGKSRLVDEFVGGLGDDVVVARGQCVEFGTVGLPYARSSASCATSSTPSGRIRSSLPRPAAPRRCAPWSRSAFPSTATNVSASSGSTR